jgi:hypothetical protein
MSKSFTKLWSGFLALILLISVVSPAFATDHGNVSAPESDGGVTPYIIDGKNRGGNRTCAEVGFAFYGNEEYYQFSSARVDVENSNFAASFLDEFIVDEDGVFVEWNSADGVGEVAVIVKGGNASNIYVYKDGEKSDTDLASPINASGNPAGLSNLTFCWNPEEEEEPTSQWCSPGYWRQEQHLGSWAETEFADPVVGLRAITQEDFYLNPIFALGSLSLSNKVRDGANQDPSLWQVLQSPQWYGGEAFNNVGDLLSAAHPGVNFVNGERVENSCPLGRNELD